MHFVIQIIASAQAFRAVSCKEMQGKDDPLYRFSHLYFPLHRKPWYLHLKMPEYLGRNKKYFIFDVLADQMSDGGTRPIKLQTSYTSKRWFRYAVS